ncbi:MAG TPA: trypsin-like peptidase domain-containing protein [Candidatus Polarisedimenticolaceae bacterium]|nr:trypsin-like peptidase domain-containing protein [Candidatus Polarisedimenticolaceae bacterium]
MRLPTSALPILLLVSLILLPGLAAQKPPATAEPQPANPPVPGEQAGGGDLGEEAPPLIERSVVRIVTYMQRASWFSPWDMEGVSSGVGTGFVVEGGRVVTNAHVIADARMVLLFLYDDPVPHEARVVAAGHDADLALVEPVEPHLLEGVPKLQLGGLPKLRTVVETYGFPTGSDQLSSTRGVVSRVDLQVYVHSGVDRHLAVQTDAAINPGNSGGPVVQDGKVVGVAFQGTDALENVGFFIPMEVLQHFLTDVKDGSYDGYPDLGAFSATLENPVQRKAAGMTDKESGVLVSFVRRESSADGVLQVGDVLLAIDGKPIADDGSVPVDGLRLPFGLLLDRHQIGDVARFKILRDGQRREVAVPLRVFPRRELYGTPYDRLPRYFVYGGLIFVPLDQGMLETFGQHWFSEADRQVMYEYFYRPYEDPSVQTRERVVLLRRLDHPVNTNMAWYRNQVLEKVNGKEVQDLNDLVRTIESSKDRFLVFEFSGSGHFSVLDREAAQAANQSILTTYGVPKDRNL